MPIFSKLPKFYATKVFLYTVDKRFQFTHYPTRDLQRSYRLTFTYLNNINYLNAFENQKVLRGSDNRGSTVVN